MKIFDNSAIDRSWTLFLDRDGVINRRLPGDYVKRWDEFEFLPGVLDAMPVLAHIFGTIVIVTNQQGIAKGLYTEDDLRLVHEKMQARVSEHGGRIDRIYFSPHAAAENHPTRKPAIGMALQAKSDLPAIDFSKSVIVGDSVSDMQFGRTAGMKTVFAKTDGALPEEHKALADLEVNSLFYFAKWLAD
ncbi:MAG: D-glycero-D-manno-heptose 1,7-bisphosphate phosphatase [Bacteroidetes bacterium]|nr:MAG: D-glycero-D-manno-heptose 1,7-bisphosphate phosphatase [Bacteroidota bacterium]